MKTHIHTEHCTWIFTTALVFNGQNPGKTSCLKQHMVNTQIKRHKLLSLWATWVHCKGFMSEKSQSPGVTQCDSIYMRFSKWQRDKIMVTETRQAWPRVAGEGWPLWTNTGICLCWGNSSASADDSSNLHSRWNAQEPGTQPQAHVETRDIPTGLIIYLMGLPQGNFLILTMCEVTVTCKTRGDLGEGYIGTRY